MRTYTLAFSIFIHILVAGAAVMVPLVATDGLPEPRRAFEFITVRPVPIPPAPPAPPAPPRASSRHTSPANPDAAPIEAPAGIERATGIDVRDIGGGAISDGVPGGFPGGMAGGDFPVEPPPPPPPPSPPPVRVGGSIKQPQKIRDVPPLYPPIARAARVEGIVILEAVIGEDGRVRNLRVLRSIPLLDEAALDAVRQWQFTPTLLNGAPVPVVMTVTVAFTLRK